MLSEGKGTASSDAVRYLLTRSEIRKVFDKGRDYELHCPEEPGISFAFRKPIPHGATHFYRARQGDDDESWGVLGEIPQ